MNTKPIMVTLLKNNVNNIYKQLISERRKNVPIFNCNESLY